MNLQDDDGNLLPMASAETAVLRDEDKWIISLVNEAAADITNSLDKFELGLAGQKVYELIWDEYCDWYIELVKARLWSDDEEDKSTARFVLQSVLKDLLKLLHPFMPFITEEIWGYLPAEVGTAESNDNLLITASWPTYDGAKSYGESVARIETAKEIIKVIRNARTEVDAAPSRKLNLIVKTDTLKDTIDAIAAHIQKIANVVEIEVESTGSETPDGVVSAVFTGGELLIPLADLVDFEAERERLEKEKKRLEDEVARVEKKLSNQGFVAKAPASVVEEEKQKGDKYREMLETVIKRIESMGAPSGK